MRSLFLLLLGVPAFAQPVVLINGFQFPPCDGAAAESTFGQLPQRLRDLGREVIFMNSCSVPAAPGSLRPTIEEMGAALGARLAAISAPQVDVVVHSMGGLILRSYLSGKQNASGTFRPPARHKVRKAIFLGTPQFGLGLAQLLVAVSAGDPLVRSMLPGSQFLLDLGTWNQGGDDFRGINSVAVVGNVSNGTDGLAPVPPASVSFAMNPDRTRVVPYCHTNDGALSLIAAGCSRAPGFLANVNSDDHLSWRIIRSFITGTEEWRTLGTSLAADPTGSTRGGLVVAARDKDDNPVSGVTGVTAGSTTLEKVTDFYYAEQIPTGAQNITVTTPAGNSTAPQTITGGLYSVAIVKPGPVAAAILPAAGRVPTRTLAPGMFISLYGATLATESAAASSLPLPTTLAGTQLLSADRPLGLQFAGPTQINAILPEDAAGLLNLTVKSAAGASKLNIVIEPAVPAIFTQTGTGSGLASAIHAITGVVVTTQSKARAGDAISLYLTGLGATETRDGLQWAKLLPKLFIGDLEAQILYAGRAPGYAGLDQIDFVVPAGTPSGDSTPLRVESNGRVSNAVTLPTL